MSAAAGVPVTSERPAATISAVQRGEALDRLNRRRRGPLGWLGEWARSIGFALVVFLGLHLFVMEAFKIPSGSMEETLLVGDFLLVNKLTYGADLPLSVRRLPAFRAPRRGDVIVFTWPPDPSKNFVKRLVGMTGDTLSMDRGILVRNGVRVQEQYVQHTEPGVDPAGDEFRWQNGHVVRTAEAAHSYHPSRNNWGPIVVPADNYFVLGDNRDNSLDSRYWGFVPDSMVRGTPLMVYYSYVPDSSTSMPWVTRIRWSRLGERIH